jgi:hypothetical protein
LGESAEQHFYDISILLLRSLEQIQKIINSRWVKKRDAFNIHHGSVNPREPGLDSVGPKGESDLNE